MTAPRKNLSVGPWALMLLGVLLVPTVGRAQFAFNSVTGPAETFGPGAGTRVVPNSVQWSTTAAAATNWSVTTNWAINFIAGDPRCQLTAFDPGAPVDVNPWTYPAGVASFGTPGSFTWTSPDTGTTAISADYIIGFSSTATNTAGGRFVFDGNIDVTVKGRVPEPSTWTAGSLTAAWLVTRRRARRA